MLNCADYSHNKELLSSVLFGYQKGAFTGAEEDRVGLLENADGGVLFLDEMHRLAPADQEKLFLFMDKGCFCRLGETVGWRTAQVRLIFATTESFDDALIATLKRRIPLVVTLPAFICRPLQERMEIVQHFFMQEAKKLECDISVKGAVIQELITGKIMGNVGGLRNQVQLLCAMASSLNRGEGMLTIEAKHRELGDFGVGAKNTWNMLISYKGTPDTEKLYLPPTLDFFQESANFEEICNHLQAMPFSLNTHNKLFEKVVGLALGKHGRYWGIPITEKMNKKLAFCVQALSQKQPVPSVTLEERSKHNKAFTLAKPIAHDVADWLQLSQENLEVYFAAVFADYVTQEFRLPALLLAHGESTAASIAGVVNGLCQEYIFEWIDMPMNTTAEELVARVKTSVTKMDTKQGLVVLVDMGSLAELYRPIQNLLQGALLIVNYLSTPIALDIGLKITQGMRMQELIETSQNKHKVEFRYYEGVSKHNNIIISCISGMGIAQKLKERLLPYFTEKNMDIVAMEFNELSRIVKNSPTALRQTKCIVTTGSLHSEQVPVLEIHDILELNGIPMALKKVLSSEDYEFIEKVVVDFFTVEGISKQLTILNPISIHEDVSPIIQKYEDWVGYSFENYLKVNLLMHISVLVERLMLRESTYKKEMKLPYTQKQQDFISFSNKQFAPICRKYNITFPEEEALLLWEIMSHALERQQENRMISLEM